MTEPTSSPAAAGGAKVTRRRRKKLAPSQRYEAFTAVPTSSATQRELAEQYGVDRTTIGSICATATQGASDALAAAVRGRRGKTAEQVELEAARAEIERLKATICEQAVTLHLEKGKVSVGSGERARSGLNVGRRSPADVVSLWSCEAVQK